jgi:phage-related protein
MLENFFNTIGNHFDNAVNGIAGTVGGVLDGIDNVLDTTGNVVDDLSNKSAEEIAETILEAATIVANKVVESIPIDKTVEGTITGIIDIANGIYEFFDGCIKVPVHSDS